MIKANLLAHEVLPSDVFIYISNEGINIFANLKYGLMRRIWLEEEVFHIQMWISHELVFELLKFLVDHRCHVNLLQTLLDFEEDMTILNML